MEKEQRSVISYDELSNRLDDDHWLGFECVTESNTGALFWKILVLSETDDALVVVSQNNFLRTAKSITSATALFKRVYPEATHVEVPLVSGHIGPRIHPDRLSKLIERERTTP